MKMWELCCLPLEPPGEPCAESDCGDLADICMAGPVCCLPRGENWSAMREEWADCQRGADKYRGI